MSDYKTLLDKLYAVNMYSGIKLGLANMHALNDALGNPIEQYKIIHVAGTNGKGSVCTKIAAGLQAAGYRVGLFTSPHISSFRERIKINGEMIDEESSEKHLENIFTIIEKEQIPATFFEITTALALIYFAVKNVDYVVLETGLGGRLDATNIAHPILSIITSVSLEHTEILGKTLEEISIEKAGIIKANTPILIGPCVPGPPIENIAKEQNSALIKMAGHYLFYNDENNAIAKKGMEILGLKEAAIQTGLKALPPCRFEIVGQDPVVILDVAHNPDGLEHLLEAVKKKYPHKNLRIVLGLSKSKDIDGCLNVLKKVECPLHLVEATNGRGIEVATLHQKMVEHDFDPGLLLINGTIKETMEEALSAAKRNNQILLVCGTFFIMSAVRSALQIQEANDEYDLNER
jgi:dihydrofolate synthase / folylpolyglutamate synthase